MMPKKIGATTQGNIPGQKQLYWKPEMQIFSTTNNNRFNRTIINMTNKTIQIKAIIVTGDTQKVERHMIYGATIVKFQDIQYSPFNENG